MKIVFTITDFGNAIHCGADPERTSFISEIPDDLLPRQVLKVLDDKSKDDNQYQTLSISMGIETGDAWK